jgi:predicted ester cyclase
LGPHQTGTEGVKHYVEGFRNAFPDMRLTVEDQVAEGDEVLTRWTAWGLHRGELIGIPPSGNRLEMTGMSLDRFSGGRLRSAG